jgi:anti-sigma B factor antagonist
MTEGGSRLERLADGAALVHVEGDLDVTTVERFRETVLEPAADLRPGPLLIDLSGCTFLDSAGLHLLFQLLRRRDGARPDVAFVLPAGSHVVRVVEIAGLALSAPVCRTLDEARAALAVPAEGLASPPQLRRPGREAG